MNNLNNLNDIEILAQLKRGRVLSQNLTSPAALIAESVVQVAHVVFTQTDTIESQRQQLETKLADWIRRGGPDNNVGNREAVAQDIRDAFEQKLDHLYIFRKDLTTLPDVFDLQVFKDHLKKLGCDYNNLVELPQSVAQLSNLEYLNCEHNQFPDLPQCVFSCVNLKYLDFSSNRISLIPDDVSNLTKLEKIHFSDNRITGIPNIGSLTHLQMINFQNNSLSGLPIEISSLPNQSCVLLLNSNPSLDPSIQSARSIGALPGARVLPPTVPEASFGVRMLRAQMQEGTHRRLTLKVNIQEVMSNPHPFLSKLGDILEESRQFPFVAIYKTEPDGVVRRAQGQDVSGVRKEFLRILLEAEFRPVDGLTVFPTKKDDDAAIQGVFPVIPPSSDEELLKELPKTLGMVFARCIEDDSGFKTGELFHPSLFKVLAIPGFGDPAIVTQDQGDLKVRREDSLIKALLIVKDMPEGVLNLTQPQNSTETDFDPGALSAWVSPYFEDRDPPIVAFDLQNQDIRTELRTALLVEAQQEPRLLAALSIRAGMETCLSPEGEILLGQMRAVDLQEKIQGVLTPEKLKASLQYKTDYETANVEEIQSKVKGEIEGWIDGIGRDPAETEAEKLERLRRFLIAVTANSTLSSGGVVVSIKPSRTDLSIPLPLAHTCFNRLDYWENCPTQEVASQKLDWFLAGTAEAGFEIE